MAPVSWRQRTIAAFVAVCFALNPILAFAQEVEGRPLHAEEKRPDAEEHDGSEEGVSDKVRGLEKSEAEIEKQIHELDERSQEKVETEGNERAAKPHVTEVDKVARDHDLTKPSSAEFHDVDKLQQEIEADKAGERADLKNMNRVSGNKRADEIARQLGYENAHDLKKEYKTDSSADLFVDNNKNVYLGKKLGDGEPERVGKIK